MALNPTVFQDNPQTPSILAELYNPDQLLQGGPYKTEGQATISGAAVLLRGTVMGQSMEGAFTGTPGKAFGAGTITVAQVPTGGSVAGGGGGAPVGGDTMTINGTAFTFVAVPSGSISEPGVGNEVVLPAGIVAGSTATADINAVANAITTALNGSTNANVAKMTFSVSGAVVTATSKIPGTGGNAYTLAVSNSTSLTVSGANLTGGTANTGTSTIVATPGPQTIPGIYTIVVTTTSGTSPVTVTNPLGESLPNGVVGTAYTDPQLNFTITAGGTVTQFDAFVLVPAAVGASVWKACVSTATDGSDSPSGILLDTADPTSGNVNSGILLEGAVNGNALIFDPSLSLAGIKQSLRLWNIYVKDSVSSAPPQ